MSRTWPVLRLLIAAFLLSTLTLPAHAASTTYQTGFTRWRSATGGLGAWRRSGVTLNSDGTLQLDASTATRGADPYPAGGYNGRNFYNGGNFVVGEATSPAITTRFGFAEAIASWNADTPTGTWIETQIRTQIGRRWTKWYNLGVWAADTSTVERHSVNGQGDANGTVATDTWIAASKKALPRAFQLKVRLFSANTAVPRVRNMAVAFSTTAVKPGALQPGNPANWNTQLELPQCSQMVYPDGGIVWCSPTSTSMVLGYYGYMPGACEPRVRATKDGVFDWLYDGWGNWPFNTAFAAMQRDTQGAQLEAYVARFTSMTQVERWVKAGVPVIFSFAWKKGELTGAPIPSSAGHIAVIVGFDANGNPIVNDPAAASNEQVRRTYNRSELESLWLEHSGGTVYLIYPEGRATPAVTP